MARIFLSKTVKGTVPFKQDTPYSSLKSHEQRHEDSLYFLKFYHFMPIFSGKNTISFDNVEDHYQMIYVTL